MNQRKWMTFTKIAFVYLIIFTVGFLCRSSHLMAAKTVTKLVELNTRQGVTQTFVLLTPENPTASLIIFSGLFGDIKASGEENNPSIKWENSWIVKAREKFSEHGLIVAVIDAPSDHKKVGSSGHKNEPGIGLDWRLTDEHMQDINAVIIYLKQKKLPIFLVGQSLGTLSVVTAGYKLGDKISGIILSSSATKAKPPWKEKWPVYKDYPNAILDFNFLDKITAPVMIIAHEKDTCVPTPPENAVRLKDAFVKSVDAELKIYSGGIQKEKGCSAVGAHSYYGIQDQVIGDIANFILRNAK